MLLTLLQVAAVVAAPPLWLDVLRSPAVVLFALAFCTKWLVAPAVSAWTRHELQNELKQLATFPLFVDRVERVEVALDKLSEMPQQLARIEGALAQLHTERSASASTLTPQPFPRSAAS